MYGRANMVMMRGFRMDPSITKQKLKPGTIRRIAGYARPYRVHLAVFLLATVGRRGDHRRQPAAAAGDHRPRHPGPQRPGRDRARLHGRGRLDLRRGARLRDPLVLRPDRRRPHLRPAHPGVRSRAAAADRLFHPGADGVAGQPPRRRRGRSPAGNHLHAVRRDFQPAQPDPHPDNAVLPVLAGHRHRPGHDPAVHPARPAGRPPDAAADQGEHAAQRRDGLDDDRAVQRGGRHAGQAVRAAARGVRVRSPRARPRSATSASSPRCTARCSSSRSRSWPRW